MKDIDVFIVYRITDTCIKVLKEAVRAEDNEDALDFVSRIIDTDIICLTTRILRGNRIIGVFLNPHEAAELIA